jgi:hypothetical protein
MFAWIKKWKERKMLKKLRSLAQVRINNQVPEEQILLEIKLLNQLGQFYLKNKKLKIYPYAHQMYENALRIAAQIGDENAQLTLGKELLNQAKSRVVWQSEEVIANKDNQTKIDDLFFQAHVFLQEAAKKSVEAQRMLGLCSIHGWGEPIDRKKGFSLIVESINREDSWDKLPEIFSKIGLNKPEFLKELIKFRTQEAG